MRSSVVLIFSLFLLCFAPPNSAASTQPEYFAPIHRLSGIGAGRADISDEVLAARTDLMIESQTFAIMRDSQALPGAQRITSAGLQAIFRQASTRSGLPQSLIEAITYLESWGNPLAESPAGPKGIMQISEGTARAMGLRVVRATRYRKMKERVLVRRKGGKPRYKTVTRRIPYTVMVRDERLNPRKAIPAAAVYLARMEQKFGGRDWAVFAYHCGEGCVSDILSLAERAKGVKGHPVTVARAFFSCSPVHNRDLHEMFQQQMERDYSPTYWFRVRRAEQLLALYRGDPDAFRNLAQEYRSQLLPSLRAPNRLSVWLKTGDVAYHSCEDLKNDRDGRLVRALDDPEFFGYSLRTTGPAAIGGWDPANQQYYMQNSPSAMGTLLYIAFETRRLFDELHPRGEKYQPLEVTSLVQPMDSRNGQNGVSALMHCTGQVFDLAWTPLPRAERECLRFVLDDLGWEGYLGFVEESPRGESLHVGCSPSARDFFALVFQEAAREGHRESKLLQ